MGPHHELETFDMAVEKMMSRVRGERKRGTFVDFQSQTWSFPVLSPLMMNFEFGLNPTWHA
jgi:hypothetical protein